MEKAIEKDAALIQLLAQLRERLGGDAFEVVDHWEADLCAVGIASPHNHGILAYLSTYGCVLGCCNVELELPTANGQDGSYLPVGKQWHVGFNDVVEIVREHLSRGER